MFEIKNFYEQVNNKITNKYLFTFLHRVLKLAHNYLTHPALALPVKLYFAFTLPVTFNKPRN